MSDELFHTNIEIEKIKATQETCVQDFEHEIMEKVSSQLTEFSKKVSPTTNASPSSIGNFGRRKQVITRRVPESSNENIPAIVKKIAKD